MLLKFSRELHRTVISQALKYRLHTLYKASGSQSRSYIEMHFAARHSVFICRIPVVNSKSSPICHEFIAPDTAVTNYTTVSAIT